MKIGNKLILGSTSRVIALVANVLIGLLLMPFVVHTLGDRFYGYWVLAATFLGYYGLFDLGLVGAVQYYVARAIGERKQERANQAICSLFYAFAFMGILIFLVVMIVSFLSTIFIDDPAEGGLFRTILLITGAGFAIGFPCRVFIGTISAHLRFDLISVVNVGGLLFRSALIVIVLKLHYGIVGLALVTSGVELCKNLLLYLIIKRIHHGLVLSADLFSMSALKAIITYGIFNFIFKTALQVRSYIYPFVISGLITVEAVTHYSIAARLQQYFMSFMIASFGLLAPVFSQLQGAKNNEDMEGIFILGTKCAVYVGTLVALSLVLYGDEFIVTWMGDRYLDAYVPLVILVSGLFFEVCQFPSVSYLQGIAKHRFLAYVAIVEITAVLTLSLHLARVYGMAGMAMGMAIPMTLVKVCIQPIYVCRQLRISPRYYYVRVLGQGMLVAVFSIFVPWVVVLRHYSEGAYLNICTLIFIQVIVSLPIAYLLIFDRTEKSKIVNYLFGESKVG